MQLRGGKIFTQLTAILVLILQTGICHRVEWIHELGDQALKYFETHPEQKWLVKFYASWCHRCQQFDPVFSNVAQDLVSQIDDLLVGQVSCDSFLFSPKVCREFEVFEYPVVYYVHNNTHTRYKGLLERTELVNFVKRAAGPLINTVNSCEELKSLIPEREVIVLSTHTDAKNDNWTIFKSASERINKWRWIYHFNGSCESFVEKDRFYVLKKDLNWPIEFPFDFEKRVCPTCYLAKWFWSEAHPIFGRLNSKNLQDKILANKLMVIAILDEYKPAKKLSPGSNVFKKKFAEVAKRASAIDDDLLFMWTTDLELIETTALRGVQLPNVMIMRPDFSFHLMIPELDHSLTENKILERLTESQIKMHITTAKLDELSFEGGDTPLHRIAKYLYRHLWRLVPIYKANPWLTILMIFFPVCSISMPLAEYFFYKPDHDLINRKVAEEMVRMGHDPEEVERILRLVSQGTQPESQRGPQQPQQEPKQSQPEPQSQPQSEPQPEPQLDLQSEPGAESQPEPQLEPQSELQSEPQQTQSKQEQEQQGPLRRRRREQQEQQQEQQSAHTSRGESSPFLDLDHLHID